MIPRIFHQIWVGGKPLPAPFAAWGEGIRALHPGWEHRLWNDAQIEALLQDHFPRHLELYRRTRSYSQRSEIGRYAIMAVHGGVYLDTDCEGRRALDFIRDTDELIVAPELRTTSRKVKKFYRTWRDELYCQWMFIARPGLPFLSELLDELARRMSRTVNPDPFVNAIDQSGPGAFTDILQRHLASGATARIVPGSWFGCPDGTSLFRFSRSFMFPELARVVYVRHHSQVSWIDPKEKRHWMLRSFFFLTPPLPQRSELPA